MRLRYDYLPRVAARAPLDAQRHAYAPLMIFRALSMPLRCDDAMRAFSTARQQAENCLRVSFTPTRMCYARASMRHAAVADAFDAVMRCSAAPLMRF